MNELMKFENVNVGIIERNGEPLFEIYSVGMALGYARKNSVGNSYPRKERIEQTLENAEITTCVHCGHNYITEAQLYDFMLEARTDKCKTFRKWVTNEVLPQIRRTGGYISITEDMDEKEILARALLITQKTIEEQTPLVEFTKAVGGAEGDLLVREVAKLLCNDGFQIGQNKLFEKFREWGWMVKKASKNEPTQFAINAGYLAAGEYVFNTLYGDKLIVTPKVTPKGQIAIFKKLREERMQKLAA